MKVNPVPMPLVNPARASVPAAQNTGSFAALLQGALTEVNDYQLAAEEAARLLAAGLLTDVHQATIAAEKAELSLQLTLEVRNKLVEAYQEIMRMQV